MKTIFTIILVILVSNMYAQMPANDNNPYDLAGSLHNAIFNYAKEKLSHKSTREDIARMVDEYFREHGRKEQPSLLLLNPEYISFYVEFMKGIQKNAVLSSIGNFSPEGIAYFQQLLKVLKMLDYAELYNSMLNLEASIITDPSLETSEKQILLAAASVGRYSAYNWNENVAADNADKETGWTEDAAGAVSGGAMVVLGVIVPTVGVGVVPGWFVGAVAGGVSSSLEHLITHMLE